MTEQILSFIDSHCHLDFAIFDEDRTEELSSCKALGIDSIVIPAVAPASLERQFAVINKQGCNTKKTQLYGAAGLHPGWVHKYSAGDKVFSELSQTLDNWSSYSKCIAIGECGLDKYAEADMDLQTKAFILQLEFARQYQLPILLHVRGAHNEMLQLLKQYPNQAGGIVHGFSGSPELAQSYWRLGYRLGIGGAISYARAKKTCMAVKALPLEAMVLETDAPDMPLAGFQGQRNQPSKLIKVAQCMAAIKQCSLAEVAARTTANCRSLFTLS